ncbi:uncharacterized protein NDAI_0D03010 [Naumovozyma dairenensis CBS 421]|uniref:Uncharacterized protein n=1 Tax=Naumovozyma dairenensis (strain ATCC 10597 / BCRC 20456 / CBS 421 / NBRC 0211 / NRRL Y-12639) TaxID=1071378 RepID=G0WA04_NAUDC|nr:hypothetical protein NDAI_0D03010 [Naumovozyma dairenensis CBS 421]CCD24615.1 hypothetical protein NDAI_0D03010 [Naumovozyma dairenensis CBS 421]
MKVSSAGNGCKAGMSDMTLKTRSLQVAMKLMSVKKGTYELYLSKYGELDNKIMNTYLDASKEALLNDFVANDKYTTHPFLFMNEMYAELLIRGKLTPRIIVEEIYKRYGIPLKNELQTKVLQRLRGRCKRMRLTYKFEDGKLFFTSPHNKKKLIWCPPTLLHYVIACVHENWDCDDYTLRKHRDENEIQSILAAKYHNISKFLIHDVVAACPDCKPLSSKKFNITRVNVLPLTRYSFQRLQVKILSAADYSCVCPKDNCTKNAILYIGDYHSGAVWLFALDGEEDATDILLVLEMFLNVVLITPKHIQVDNQKIFRDENIAKFLADNNIEVVFEYRSKFLETVEDTIKEVITTWIGEHKGHSINQRPNTTSTVTDGANIEANNAQPATSDNSSLTSQQTSNNNNINYATNNTNNNVGMNTINNVGMNTNNNVNDNNNNNSMMMDMGGNTNQYMGMGYNHMTLGVPSNMGLNMNIGAMGNMNMNVDNNPSNMNMLLNQDHHSGYQQQQFQQGYQQAYQQQQEFQQPPHHSLALPQLRQPMQPISSQVIEQQQEESQPDEQAQDAEPVSNDTPPWCCKLREISMKLNLVPDPILKNTPFDTLYSLPTTAENLFDPKEDAAPEQIDMKYLEPFFEGYEGPPPPSVHRKELCQNGDDAFAESPGVTDVEDRTVVDDPTVDDNDDESDEEGIETEDTCIDRTIPSDEKKPNKISKKNRVAKKLNVVQNGLLKKVFTTNNHTGNTTTSGSASSSNTVQQPPRIKELVHKSAAKDIVLPLRHAGT